MRLLATRLSVIPMVVAGENIGWWAVSIAGFGWWYALMETYMSSGTDMLRGAYWG
jgi:hypothetical protein